MRCPFCKVDDDRVIDSRASSDGYAIRRRRQCLSCERRFTTYERIEESPLRVIKKDERREPLDRRKIILGMMKASEKRPIGMPLLEEATEEIENRILEEYDAEVPTTYIGQLVMDALKQIDQVAYVRFASVYREFEDITDFAEELKQMRLDGSTKRAERTPASDRQSSGKSAMAKSATRKTAKGKKQKGTKRS